MIIYCEECGAKNILPDLYAQAPDEPVRCQICYDILKIHRRSQVPAEPVTEQPLILSRLWLKYKDVRIEHGGPGKQITMGRQEGSDICVQDERVSRLHALIEYKQGKYCLIDRSLNGTFVLITNRQGRTIKHEEIMLVNQGIIGLGGVVDEQSPHVIHYRIVSQ